MSEISLCMIVKNEEDVLGRCLESVKEVVDEIVIVDTGSTDETKEIAKRYTNAVYNLKWEDDFAKARNFSFSKATKDYIMWLDADDVILPIDKIKLLQLKNELTQNTQMVAMKYNVAFDASENPTFSYYRERIFLRSKNYQWEGRIHETIAMAGNIIYSDAAISHKKMQVKDPKRNLNIFRKMITEGVILKPREQFYYAREIYYSKEYEEAIKWFEIFLKDKQGWIENNIEACSIMAKCYEEMKQEDKMLQSLFRSFEYDVPRAEICCEIGKYFFNKSQYKIAIFWYELALSCEKNEQSGGFVLLDCYSYIPSIQLCVCYHKIGDLQKAIWYNEKAGESKSEDKAYLYNKKYFDSADIGNSSS